MVAKSGELRDELCLEIGDIVGRDDALCFSAVEVQIETTQAEGVGSGPTPVNIAQPVGVSRGVLFQVEIAFLFQPYIEVDARRKDLNPWSDMTKSASRGPSLATTSPTTRSASS